MIIIKHITVEKPRTCKICGSPLSRTNSLGICPICAILGGLEAKLIRELESRKQFKTKDKTMSKIPDQLIEYIKNEDNRAYGVMVAKKILKPKPIVRIGLSLCNTNVDVFVKEIGVSMALERCLSLEPYTIHASGVKKHNGIWRGGVMRSDNMLDVTNKLFWFMERAGRYFKDCTVQFPSNLILL